MYVSIVLQIDRKDFRKFLKGMFRPQGGKLAFQFTYDNGDATCPASERSFIRDFNFLNIAFEYRDAITQYLRAIMINDLPVDHPAECKSLETATSFLAVQDPAEFFFA